MNNLEKAVNAAFNETVAKDNARYAARIYSQVLKTSNKLEQLHKELHEFMLNNTVDIQKYTEECNLINAKERICS